MKLTHDNKIEIATGWGRDCKTWKNQTIKWSALVAKLSETRRTDEKYTTYLGLKRELQDKIKDIGGFVGGYLQNGRRLKGSILHRSILTLDADTAKADLWDDFTLLYGNAAALYSTHKHSPDKPRYRLILPLDREVTPEEYCAIGRKIAAELDIDQFDHTGFQPERLMYWPSTAKDGVYEFQYQDGPWISADHILESYRDWKDSSEWPMTSRENEIPQRGIKKQGDPLEKSGIIGAFCRTYSIESAIDTFLADVYTPCDVEGRYTYVHGSTAGGLVIYEDKYAFSHHGTDPISGKLCNAFDLVRLHKFGLQDEDAKPDTSSTKLPSYKSMCDFVAKDKAVLKLMGTERIQDAMGDFAGQLEEEIPEDDGKWLETLKADKDGVFLSTINNAVVILNNDPRLKGRLAYNQFEQRPVILSNLPWRQLTTETKNWSDVDDAGIRHYLEDVYQITGVQKIKDAVELVQRANGFHPVRDYLNSLQWDGEERLDTVLVDYMGVKDCDYTRAITRKALIAAVARVMEPGCKFDYVLTLVGKEGVGKSTLFSKLGGRWFSDTFMGVSGKEAYEQLQGVWIMEWAELSGLKKAELEAVKQFISKQIDRFREAYGRRIEDFQRQCIFIASTNNYDFLKGSTGNRRFWPADVMEEKPSRSIQRDLTQNEIDQLWAEAVNGYNDGELLYLSKELEAEALKMQDDHTEVDERAALIRSYLDTLLPDNWEEKTIYERRAYLQNEDGLEAIGTIRRDRVCAAEIWCELFNGRHSEMTSHNTRFIHEAMRRMKGWKEGKSKTVFKSYGNQKSYSRINKLSTPVG